MTVLQSITTHKQINILSCNNYMGVSFQLMLSNSRHFDGGHVKLIVSSSVATNTKAAQLCY
jgi:hypothetical protein